MISSGMLEVLLEPLQRKKKRMRKKKIKAGYEAAMNYASARGNAKQNGCCMAYIPHTK